MIIIKDGFVRMTNLAVFCVYSVNGVAEIHTNILEHHTFKEFYKYFPYKFHNETNGVTHRRWLIYSNPDLADLLTKKIGIEWIKNPEEGLLKLLDFKDDEKTLEELMEVKKINKQKLAKYIQDNYGLTINTDYIFDVQVKRLHV